MQRVQNPSGRRVPKIKAQATQGPPKTKLLDVPRKGPLKAAERLTNELTKDWVQLEKNVHVCGGSFSQAHKRFRGRNKQSSATCIVACAFCTLQKMNTWTRDTLDLIVTTGNGLYLKSRLIPENRCREELQPSQVYKYFFVDILKISMGVSVNKVSERITRDSMMIRKLEDLLSCFFRRYQSGIFSSLNTYFAIWKVDKYYFIFDPTEHTKIGGKWCGLPGSGHCYCIRSGTLKFLAEVIMKNCSLKQVNKFVIHPCTVEKLVKINTTPPKDLEDVRPVSESVEIPKTSQVLSVPPVQTKAPPDEQGEEERVGSVDAEKSDPETQREKAVPVKIEKKPSEPKIPLERPKLKSVTNFTELIAGTVGILRGSTHQRNPKFTRYMGAQSFANGLAALTMLRQEKSKYWVKRTVDDVLRLGERIHHDSKKLPLGQFPKKVTLNEKEYTPEVGKYGSMGIIMSQDDKILGLSEALKNFLIDYDCCIVNGPNVVAVWKEERKYYLFDPEERSTAARNVQEGITGVACVTWWARLEDLIKIYVANIPKTSLKDRFMLSSVKIKDYSPVADDWHNFKAITLNKWILRGDFSQADQRYPQDTRNSQCTANSAMALTYKELKEERDWSSETINKLLMSGDDFYRSCVESLKDCGRFKHPHLMADELNRNFIIENKKVLLEIDDCLVNGILKAKDDSGILSLQRGFLEFFNDSEAGIVTANNQTMAVWKRDDVFYYCDSHSRDDKGVAAASGKACLLRMLTLEDLTNSLLMNLEANTENLYNISRITVKLMDVAEDGAVKAPLNAYQAIGEFIGILRGTESLLQTKVKELAEVPMCLTAVGFNAVTVSSLWNQEDVNEILRLGEGLYMEMKDAYIRQDPPAEEDFDPVTTNNVKTEMTIAKNAITVEFEEVSSGNFEENLKEGLESLGQRSDQEGVQVFQSILESSHRNLSMWRDENLYYLFDPKPRDEEGQMYGKDDWSVKIEIPEEEEQEAVVEKKDEDEWKDNEETDELAGGDNLGEQEEEVNYTPYENDEKADNEEENEVEGDEEENETPVVEKKGSDFWAQKEQTEGKSCVMRFSRLEDLINHILDNSPPNRRQDIIYILKAVKIASNTPIVHEITESIPDAEEQVDEFVGDWNEFKEFDYGRWILRGSKNLKDALYPVCNRAKQAIPMCVVALSFVNLYDVAKFTGAVIDKILAFGDRLHTVLRKLRIRDLRSNKELGLSVEEAELILSDMKFELKEYPQKICIGEKMSIWDVTCEVVQGDTTSKEPEAVHNLTSGVTKFFEEYSFGILINRDYPVAIWKREDIFYMFDPHPNGPSGKKSLFGVACITRFKDLEHLTEIYFKDLPKVGDHFFEIHALTFKEEKCVRARHPEEKVEKPPRIGGFSLVTAGKSILRGDVKLDCTKFSRGVNIHSSAIAFVALALSLSKDPDIWTHNIVNEIVTFGEELHNESVFRLDDKFDPWGQTLDVCKVNADFTIGSLKVNTAIRFREQKGIVDVKNSRTTLNLRQGIEQFFSENTHGILVADKFILAIWEQLKEKDAQIYLFDPNSRGGTGLPGQGGVPCVMKFINSKLASDHIMSCMMDIDKTKTEFSIVPIEIVVGTRRSKRKPCKCPLEASTTSAGVDKAGIKTLGTTAILTKPSCDKMSSKEGTAMAPTSRRPPCPCPPKSVTIRDKSPRKCGQIEGVKKAQSTAPPTCPDKKTLLEEKRLLRKLAEDKRAKEEQRRCALLGRTKFHELSSNQAIIRGQRSMEKHRELPVNLAAFVFLKISPDINKWTYRNIEVILEAGYQLYVDSYNTYKPPSPKLGIQYVLRRIILKDHCAKFEIKKPIIGNNFSRGYLLAHLNQFFILTNFCILNYEDALVSIYFKNGYYYLFDPYGRDLNGNKAEDGSAMVMRFGDLSELVDKILKNLKNPEEVLPKKYALFVVNILGVERVAQATMKVNCQ